MQPTDNIPEEKSRLTTGQLESTFPGASILRTVGGSHRKVYSKEGQLLYQDEQQPQPKEAPYTPHDEMLVTYPDLPVEHELERLRNQVVEDMIDKVRYQQEELEHTLKQEHRVEQIAIPVGIGTILFVVVQFILHYFH